MATMNSSLEDITQCPHCNSDNIIDRYEELLDANLADHRVQDPILYCNDCQKYCSTNEPQKTQETIA